MTTLSDIKRSQLVGACMAGTSVTKITELFGVARSTVSKIMTGKTSSLKQNSGRNQKPSNRDRQILMQIVKKGSQEYSSKNYSRA